MPTNPTKPMQQRWEEAQRALEAVRRDETILLRLRRVGYGPERIEEGEALLAGVMLAMEQVDEALKAQRAATRTLRRMRQQLEASYRDAVQLARVALGEEHPWLERAGVERRRGRGEGATRRDGSLDGTLARAERFFKAALGAEEEVQTELASMGLGAMAIKMAQGLIVAVQRARDDQEARMAQCAEAVQVRSNALETLDDWMRAFATVARVALRERPDLLEQLGIRPRGRPRKRGKGK